MLGFNNQRLRNRKSRGFINPPIPPSNGSQPYPYLMNELGQPVLNEKGQMIYISPEQSNTFFVMGTDSNTAILADNSLIGIDNDKSK